MIPAVVLAVLSLNAALDRAVTVSPEVTQARERVREEAALLAAARSSASPAVTANYAQSPQAGNNNDTIAQRLVTVGGQVTLGDYFTYSPAVRQAQANLDAAQFDLLEAQRGERVKTAGLYFSTLRADAELTLRDQLLAGAQSDLRAAQLRFRAGDAPRLDIVRAQVSLARAQGDRNAAATNVLNAQSALEIELDEPVKLDLTAAFPTAVAVADPQTFVLRALSQRSDLASAEKAVAAEVAAVGVARRGNLPGIVVNAGYTAGTDSGIFVRGPSANVQLTFPISRTASDRAAAGREPGDRCALRLHGASSGGLPGSMSLLIAVYTTRAGQTSTHFATCLAWTLAHDHRVLLVDCDMEGGTIADLLLLPTRERSIANCFGDRPAAPAELEDQAVTHPGRDRLRVVPGLTRSFGYEVGECLAKLGPAMRGVQDDVVVADLGHPLAEAIVIGAALAQVADQLPDRRVPAIAEHGSVTEHDKKWL